MGHTPDHESGLSVTFGHVFDWALAFTQCWWAVAESAFCGVHVGRVGIFVTLVLSPTF